MRYFLLFNNQVGSESQKLYSPNQIALLPVQCSPNIGLEIVPKDPARSLLKIFLYFYGLSFLKNFLSHRESFTFFVQLSFPSVWFNFRRNVERCCYNPIMAFLKRFFPKQHRVIDVLLTNLLGTILE